MNIPIEKRALEILKNYNGTNDYILSIKKQNDTTRLFVPTKRQSEYIVQNYRTAPLLIERQVEIHKSCRQFVQDQLKIDFLPDKIFIKKLLSRRDDLLFLLGCYGEDTGKYQYIYISKECMRKTNPIPKLDFSNYQRPPKPHQIPAIEKLLQNPFFLLADDMGLGKTTSAIIAAMEAGFKKILVICPASLKINWKKEIANYDNEKNISIVDSGDFRVAKWTIVNYDILKNFHHLPERGKKIENLPTSPIDFNKFDLVIADEAHYLKSSTANRTKIFNDFASRIPNRWFLTGTPVTNKPVDLYNILHMCESPIASDWMRFVKRYCDGKQFKRKGGDKKYWVVSGASNLDELRDYISDIMLRRTKKDSGDLPQKTVKPIYLSSEYCKGYHRYLREYQDWVETMENLGEELPDGQHLTKLLKIRQLLANDKLEHTIKIAEDLIENGQKVIIFSCFTETLAAIHEHFGKASVIVDGDVSAKKRDQAVVAFQENANIQVFCGNIIAAGVGLTLTAGTVVIFNDLDWVPANHAQAEDRAHRIGQEHPVHAIYPIFDETLDVLMYETLQKKMAIIAQILGEGAKFENVSMISDVIKQLRA